MIRIDEIYYNVFAAAMQHRPKVGLHWFDPFGSTLIDDMCSVPPIYGIADLRLIFWDQEPLYHKTVTQFFEKFLQRYQGPCMLVTSETDSDMVRWVRNTYGIDSAYYFFHGWAALDWYRGYDHTFLWQPWKNRQFKHTFLCPNNTIGGNRSHRLRLFADLCRKNLVKDNLISMPEVCPYENTPAVEIARTLRIDLDLQPWLPQVIDTQQNHADNSHRIDFWERGCQAFCHVVTETLYDSDRLHLTEKTFKPIVMQQPFILVAPRGSLSYLRRYGFQTFDAIWDESYDQYPDQERIGKIAEILAVIDQWNEDDRRHAQQQIDKVVMHNFKWFYSGFAQMLWKETTEMIAKW